MSPTPPGVGRREVKTRSAMNRRRKKICEILRNSGNRERATKLLRAMLAYEVQIVLRQKWHRRDDRRRLNPWTRVRAPTSRQSQLEQAHRTAGERRGRCWRTD